MIFRQAGIRIEWLNCLPGAGRQQKGVNCTQSPGVSPVGLRILPRLTATPGFIPEGALGVAVGNLASVSFARVKEFAELHRVPQFQILGRAMAHEIAHILLGSSSHSPEGIMRPRWQDADLKFTAVGNMLFTAKQAELLTTEVLTRSRQRQASESLVLVSQP